MGKVIIVGKSIVCDEPDRDVPKIKCGYPIPCPFHTAIMDAEDPNFAEKLRHLARMKRHKARST